ncbi:hypothetical protein EJ05DRAFT_490515 [Pseudovirgaria hyperparasitica]|uniref:Uncharacterized protein n=1 Tax=Pseudovirgaria hyperparasitica TaxID=470096 RepID=A0A6A6VSQ4_9PEZI|nr:uncharacterized protein EJ05DRAFT_490515 [Pseudovirgaria hyperparasitica]KAF2752909.1 hypothetical protein EJ05DRAFT_490515 [Pseudovirgaria hyperparasitica]
MEDDVAISNTGAVMTTDIDNLPINIVVPSEAYLRLPLEYTEKENVEDTKMEDDAANTNIRVVSKIDTNIRVVSKIVLDTNIRVVSKIDAPMITDIDNSPTNAVVPLDTGETYL